MAKGLRASVKKGNRVRLRAKVFQPATDARTQRLSAKLLELAAAVKPTPAPETRMDVDQTESEKRTQSNPEEKDAEMEDVDMSKQVDTKKGSNGKHRSNRVEKRRAKSSSILYLGPRKGAKSRRSKKR